MVFQRCSRRGKIMGGNLGTNHHKSQDKTKEI